MITTEQQRKAEQIGRNAVVIDIHILYFENNVCTVNFDGEHYRLPMCQSDRFNDLFTAYDNADFVRVRLCELGKSGLALITAICPKYSPDFVGEHFGINLSFPRKQPQ
jgi:hypothetical protein